MKKILQIGLSCSVVLSSLMLVGCEQKASKGSEEFSLFADELVPELVGNESMDINFLFNDPAASGIDVEEYKLDYTTQEEYEDSIEESKAILEELKTFDYDALNEDQQLTHDVLEETLALSVEREDMYFLSTNYLDVNNGVPQNLSLHLYFYNIHTQLDLDSFIAILQSTPSVFKEYVAFEQVRQEEGFGLSKTYMNDVMEQIQTFIDGNHDYVIEGANAQIDALTFLDDAQKQEAKQAVLMAYQDNFIPAYHTLLEDLKNIEIKTEDENASLADYEGGKDYYALKIKEYTGFEDVEEYRTYLEEVKNEAIDELIALIMENPDIDLEQDLTAVPYTTIQDINELISFFQTTVEENDEYPLLDSLEFNMVELPESLREIIQASAMYFLSPIDQVDAQERLVLNGTFSPSDYGTVAHEGYPGHMYQHNYAKQAGHHPIRLLLANLGYSETWATYVAHDMNRYSDEPVMAKLVEINDLLTYAYILELDLNIHYDNATKEEVLTTFENEFGLTGDDAEEQYHQLLENPGVFIPYYGYYYRFLDLQEDVIEMLGDEYDAKEFHTLILDLGGLSYPLLEERVQEALQ